MKLHIVDPGSAEVWGHTLRFRAMCGIRVWEAGAAGRLDDATCDTCRTWLARQRAVIDDEYARYGLQAAREFRPTDMTLDFSTTP